MPLDHNIQAYRDVDQNFEAFSDADRLGTPPPPKLYLKVEGGNRMVTTLEETESSSVDEIIAFSKKLLSENKSMSTDDKSDLHQSLVHLSYRIGLEGYEGQNDSMMGELDQEEVEPDVKNMSLTPDVQKLLDFLAKEFFPGESGG